MRAANVQLLGRVRARVGDQDIDFAADKRYQLLAYLAYKGDWVSRDELAFLFWPDVPDHSARHSLRQLIKRVRKLNWLADLESRNEQLR